MEEYNFLKLVKMKNPVWEYVERQKRIPGRDDAVIIVPVITAASGEKSFILVTQYRPPTGGTTIEFPAGLVDPDENETYTAARELLEETGYLCDESLVEADGKIKAKKTLPEGFRLAYKHDLSKVVAQNVFSNTGLTNESYTFVEMEVPLIGNDSESVAKRRKANGQTGEESIKVVVVPVSKLGEYMMDQQQSYPNIRLDAKIQTYAMGLQLAASIAAEAKPSKGSNWLTRKKVGSTVLSSKRLWKSG